MYDSVDVNAAELTFRLYLGDDRYAPSATARTKPAGDDLVRAMFRLQAEFPDHQIEVWYGEQHLAHWDVRLAGDIQAQLWGDHETETSPLPSSADSPEWTPDIVQSEDNPAVGRLAQRSSSRKWGRAPRKMQDEAHFLSNINEETRYASCSAHGSRVPIQIRDRRNGKLRWRCAEQHSYMNQRDSE